MLHDGFTFTKHFLNIAFKKNQQTANQQEKYLKFLGKSQILIVALSEGKRNADSAFSLLNSSILSIQLCPITYETKL